MKRALLLIAISTVALAANANVLYDNGAPDLRDGNEFTHWTQLDDVKLVNPGTFNTVRFWTLEGSTALSTLDVSIYNNYGTNVPTWLFTVSNVSFTHTATGNTFGGGALTEYEVVANVGNIPAGNAIPFYVGLLGNAATNPNGDRQGIYWETTNTGAGQTGQELPFGSTTFNDNGNEHAFRLEYNAVPEPASMSVLGLGAIALIRKRRRK